MTEKTKKSQTAAKANLSRRLAAYSLAAGAALALPQAAEAEILCGNVDTVLHVNDPVLAIDVDGDGFGDLYLSVFGNVSAFFAGVGVVGGAQVLASNGGTFPYAMDQPSSISLPPGTGTWISSGYALLNMGYYSSSGSNWSIMGNFNNAVPGYIGLRFEVNPGEYAYGWLEYMADYTNPAAFSGYFGQWAMETDLNVPIIPGDIGTCGQTPAPTPAAAGSGGGGGGCFITAGSD